MDGYQGCRYRFSLGPVSVGCDNVMQEVHRHMCHVWTGTVLLKDQTSAIYGQTWISLTELCYQNPPESLLEITSSQTRYLLTAQR